MVYFLEWSECDFALFNLIINHIFTGFNNGVSTVVPQTFTQCSYLYSVQSSSSSACIDAIEIEYGLAESVLQFIVPTVGTSLDTMFCIPFLHLETEVISVGYDEIIRRYSFMMGFMVDYAGTELPQSC